jgi:transcription termination/antitermination protein NusG
MTETSPTAETAEKAPETRTPPSDAKWYVVHAYSGHEEKVRANLLKRVESMDMHDKIFDVLVPTENVIEIKDGQRRSVARRIFPGYILVNMVMTDESWYVVRNTPGVTSFVGSGNKPVPLQEHEIRNIIGVRSEPAAAKVTVEYQVGENVRVVDGPFTDFHGKVVEINPDKGKLKVLVNMFGRETPVELDLLQVERIR